MPKKQILLTGIGDKIGGVESFSTLIIDGMKDDYDFSIFAATDKKIAKENYFKENCKNIFYLKNIFGMKHFFSRFKVMDKFFQENKFDVVHINANTLNAYYIAKEARKNNISVIYHIHNSSPSGFSFLKKKITIIIAHVIRKKLRRLNGVKFVAVSEDAGQKVYGKRIKYVVILNGIDTGKYLYSDNNRNRYREIFNILEHDKVGITVARLMPIKNYNKIMEICKKGIPQYFDKFYIVGSGPERERLQRFITANNLQKKVYLLGERSDVDQLMSMADFMLLTSFSEGLSISVLEAQAAGLIPIVSTGIPKITNITGLVNFVNLNEDLDKWLTIINEVLTMNSDKQMMNEVVRDSKYSKSYFLSQIKKLYR